MDQNTGKKQEQQNLGMEHIQQRSKRLEKKIQEYLKENNLRFLLPPWLQYSYIPRYSIGWRMGYGGEYLEIWRYYYASMNAEEKSYYIRKFPENEEWKGFY